jgi:hypothetical protein
MNRAVVGYLPLTDRLKKGGNKDMHAYTCTYNDRGAVHGTIYISAETYETRISSQARKG